MLTTPPGDDKHRTLLDPDTGLMWLEERALIEPSGSTVWFMVAPTLQLNLSCELDTLQDAIVRWILTHPTLEDEERQPIINKSIVLMRRVHPSRPLV